MKIKYFVFFNLERKRPLKDCNFTRMSAVAKKKLQRNARGREQCYLNNSYFFFPYFFFFFFNACVFQSSAPPDRMSAASS